jgi:hypothetical protein
MAAAPLRARDSAQPVTPTRDTAQPVSAGPLANGHGEAGPGGGAGQRPEEGGAAGALAGAVAETAALERTVVALLEQVGCVGGQEHGQGQEARVRSCTALRVWAERGRE